MVPSCHAVVTGAAGALGRHLCLALAREGASVAAVDLDSAGLARVSQATEGLPGAVHTFIADVANAEACAEVVTRAEQKIGPLDLLINNAGISRDGYLAKLDERGAVVKMPRAQWQKVLDVNLTGPFLMTREVVAHMLANGRTGLILHVSSVSRHGIAGQANYSSTKAALAVTAKVWADELGPHGIRVASIAPGFLDPPLAMSTTALEAMLARVPLRRLGTLDELVRGVRFVIECDYFNGKCLEIDGGLTV